MFDDIRAADTKLSTDLSLVIWPTLLEPRQRLVSNNMLPIILRLLPETILPENIRRPKELPLDSDVREDELPPLELPSAKGGLLDFPSEGGRDELHAS